MKFSISCVWILCCLLINPLLHAQTSLIPDQTFAAAGAISKLSTGGIKVGMADPAAVYCEELGYEYTTVENENGQQGICRFSENETCDSWDFLKGLCGVEHSFCEKSGLKTLVLSDGNNSLSRQYAVCVNAGQTIGKVTDLIQLEERSTKSKSYLPADLNMNNSVSASSAGDKSLPQTFDWRNYQGRNWLTSVRNQGACGSCWAFAAVGAVEAAFNIQDDPELQADLSEKTLVACQDGDCDGGQSYDALEYIKNNGIPDENCFPYTSPYTACSGYCSNIATRKKKIQNYTNYEALQIVLLGGPMALKEYLIINGPFVTYMGISSEFGGHFDGDVYRCNNDSSINHAVVVVGYDDFSGAWIVKNSWGSGWNSGGYAKVGYDECAIGWNAMFVSAQWQHPSCGSQGVVARRGAAWDGSVETKLSDETCGDPLHNCSFDNQLYTSGPNDWDFRVHNVALGTNKKLACDKQGASDPAAWFNLDYAWHACERDGGYKWHIGGFGDASVEWSYSPGGNGNDSSYCKFNLLSPIGNGDPSSECCCGDDYGEYPSLSPADGTQACCNMPNECVKGSQCQNYTVTSETCGNSFDDDCDGRIDCLDTCGANPGYDCSPPTISAKTVVTGGSSYAYRLDISWPAYPWYATEAIIQGKTSGSWFTLANTYPPVPTFLDPAPNPGTRKYFRIRAISNYGYLPYSNESSTALPAPTAPPTLEFFASGDNNIPVRLTGFDTDVIEYADVEMSSSGMSGPFSTAQRINYPVVAAHFQGLLPLTTYCFRAKITNRLGSTPYSAVQCARTTAPPPCNPRKQSCPQTAAPLSHEPNR